MQSSHQEASGLRPGDRKVDPRKDALAVYVSDSVLLTVRSDSSCLAGMT